jgi:hypothetical protein
MADENPLRTRYKYLIDKTTGKILLRSTGELGLRDPQTEFLVGSNEEAHPDLHMYDLALKSFQDRPASQVAAEKRDAKLLGIQEADEVRSFMKRYDDLDDDMRFLFRSLVQLPNNLLSEAMEKAESHRKQVAAQKDESKQG